MEYINQIIHNNFEGQDDYVSALHALCDYFENYPAPLEKLEITPYRLALIFSGHVGDENSIGLLINDLCVKRPVLLKPCYYFEDDEHEAVSLEMDDVYAYISKKSDLHPVTGEPSNDVDEHIYVVYHLTEEALQHV